METKKSKAEPHCLWMQAGVVKQKLCSLNYRCNTCDTDQELRLLCHEHKKLSNEGMDFHEDTGKIIFWKDKLKTRPPSKRPCIHHMKGCIEFKSCHRNYQCSNCEFDHYFNDQYRVYTVVKPVDFIDVSGICVPMGYYLHRGHMWAKVETNGDVKIGIDDFALRMLGPFDKIDLPLMGKMIHQNQENISIERGNHKAGFLSPVNGVVTAVNRKAGEQKGLLNRSPYTHGWILQVHCRTLREDLKNLMLADETETFLKQEVGGLYQILEQETGLMAADGGTLGDDIFGNAPELKWQSLVKRFLKS